MAELSRLLPIDPPPRLRCHLLLRACLLPGQHHQRPPSISSILTPRKPNASFTASPPPTTPSTLPAPPRVLPFHHLHHTRHLLPPPYSLPPLLRRLRPSHRRLQPLRLSQSPPRRHVPAVAASSTTASRRSISTPLPTKKSPMPSDSPMATLQRPHRRLASRLRRQLR